MVCLPFDIQHTLLAGRCGAREILRQQVEALVGAMLQAGAQDLLTDLPGRVTARSS